MFKKEAYRPPEGTREELLRFQNEFNNENLNAQPQVRNPILQNRYDNLRFFVRNRWHDNEWEFDFIRPIVNNLPVLDNVER